MKPKKEKFYNISDKRLNEIIQHHRKLAIEEAFVLTLGLSVMTISDHIRDLWKHHPSGKCREERFTDYVLKLWDEYNEGIFTLQEVLDCLYDECGLKIELTKDDRII